MRAHFCNLPVLHDEDDICVSDRASRALLVDCVYCNGLEDLQSMRHGDCCSRHRSLIQRFLHNSLALSI